MSKIQVQITERDLFFFQIIARAGLASNRAAEYIYGNQYAYKRLAKLSAAGYIKRKSGRITLLKKGKSLVDYDVKRINLSKKSNKEHRLALASEMLAIFSEDGFTFIPSWEYKEAGGMERHNRAIGVLSVGKDVYAVYNIGQATKDNVISGYAAEMPDLVPLGFMDAIVFYESEETRDKYLKALGPTGLARQLLVPYTPQWVDALKLHLKCDLNMFAIKTLYPKARPSDWKMADASIPSPWPRYIIADVVEDAEKNTRILQYFNHMQYNSANNIGIVLICPEEEAQRYESMLPNAEIVPVDVWQIVNSAAASIGQA